MLEPFIGEQFFTMIVFMFFLIVNVQVIPCFGKEEILSRKVCILLVVCCVLFFPVLRKQPQDYDLKDLPPLLWCEKKNNERAYNKATVASSPPSPPRHTHALRELKGYLKYFFFFFKKTPGAQCHIFQIFWERGLYWVWLGWS